MKQALVEAQKAYDADEVPVGAVVVIGNKIIARAHNLTERLNDVTAHAEMQAITAAANYLNGKYLSDCSLYVTLEPCVMCMGAIAHARVKRLVFGAIDEKRGAVCSVLHLANADFLNHQIAWQGEVLAETCGNLLRDFFKAKRKRA